MTWIILELAGHYLTPARHIRKTARTSSSLLDIESREDLDKFIEDLRAAGDRVWGPAC